MHQTAEDDDRRRKGATKTQDYASKPVNPHHLTGHDRLDSLMLAMVYVPGTMQEPVNTEIPPGQHAGKSCAEQIPPTKHDPPLP